MVPHEGKPKRKSRSRAPSIWILTFTGVGIFCLMVVGGFLSFFGGSSTTAGDYTSREVQEIIRLLCKDPACRDTRLGEAFAEDRVSLELLDAILGQPVSKAGSYPHMIWTYKTADGTATISPYRVYEDEEQTPGSVPHLVVQGGVQIVGLDSNRPVDRDALKSKLLRTKKRFDSGDGVEFEKQLAEKRRQERAAREAVSRKQEEQGEREREQFFAESAVVVSIRRKADVDFHDHVRGYFRFGSRERTVLSDQAMEWIERRSEALTAAWKADEDWRQLPLPNKETVQSAISSGKPIPVVGKDAAQVNELQEQPVDQTAVPGPQKNETAKSLDQPTLPAGSPAGAEKDKWAADEDYVELRDALPELPKQAVTKGSFTVWTDPEDPMPGQQYVIMIQIKLDNNLKRYPRSDLAGNVVGTDGYKDYFGGPTEAGYLPVMDNTVRVQACVVPGAAKLVKDVITVESKILKEKQVIDIVFLERLPATDAETAKTAPTVPEPPKTVPKKPATKSIADQTKEAMNKRVTLVKPYAPDRYKNAPTDKICVGRAVDELGKQVGLRYDFAESTKNTDPVCRRWVQPNIRNQSFGKALYSILQPVGLTYSIDAGVIVLKRR